MTTELFAMPLKYCFASCSLGPPTEPLENKLTAMSQNGFDSIELSMPDLLDFTSKKLGKDVDPCDFEELAKAASDVRLLCEERKLRVALLQPFAHFEGWDRESDGWKDAWTRLRGWITIMKAANCDTLQVGSSDSPAVVRDRAGIVDDLKMLADELAKHKLRCAYENWCWSVHAPGWKDVWDICKKVNKPNFGLCLDTFQAAGAEWADPSWSDGLVQHAEGEAGINEAFKQSLEQLANTVSHDRIYFLQISDAFKVDPPFSAASSTPPRSLWSQSKRPPPFNGGYLPVQQVFDAVTRTGFQGPFSIETFDEQPVLRTPVQEYAQRCMESLQKLEGGYGRVSN